MRQGVVARHEPAAVPLYGAILLATDMTTERDMRALMPDGLGSCTTRIRFENPTTPDNLARTLPYLEEAAGLLAPGADLSAIYFSCTSATIVIGLEAIARAIGAARPGVPVVTPLASAIAGYRALGVSRIAVMSPYVAETTEVVVDHFTGNGIAVDNTLVLGMADDRDMARMAPHDIVEACVAAMSPDAEALFVSCTALPAARLVPAIEERIGRPVVTSNLAGLWRTRALSGAHPPAPELGTLFGHRLAEEVR